jgi:putative hydrolase of the HAD superfamily
MKYLKEHNIRIGMLTDLTAHIQHRKIARLGLEDYIEVLVTSEEAGAEKPSRSAYDLLVSKFNVDRESILMIGDSMKKDVEGALNAGLNAIHFKKEFSDTMDKLVIKLIEEK